MLAALHNDITKNIHSDSLRVIVLSANGSVFSAGHDLKELVSGNFQIIILFARNR